MNKKALVLIVVAMIVLMFSGHSLFAQGKREGRDNSKVESKNTEEPEDVRTKDGFKELTTNGFVFRWKVQGDSLDFTIEAPTTGWVAVGFKPRFMMWEADFAIGYIEDGEVFISDDFGVSNVSHQADTRQGGSNDIIILGGRELGTTTSIQLRRPLDSKDAYDQALTPGETVQAIFAWGSNSADNFTSIHSRRGSFKFTL